MSSVSEAQDHGVALFADAASVPASIARPSRGETARPDPLPIEELTDHFERVLLLAPAGSGKSIALRRISEHISTSRAVETGESRAVTRVHLDGTRPLATLATSALPDGVLLIDGLERLDDMERDIAVGEIAHLATAHPGLGYVVVVRQEHVTDILPGDIVGLLPLTHAQIIERLEHVAGHGLAWKALSSSRDLVLDVGRRPLHLDYLLEVLLGYGNLPPRREALLGALVDHRIDQEVASGEFAEEHAWQIREPLGRVAWELVSKPGGAHRVPSAAVQAAFDAVAPGHGARGLDLSLRAGLLMSAPGDMLMFSSSELESWFAGIELARRLQYGEAPEIVPVEEPRVQEATVLAAARLEDAGGLVRHALAHGQDLLAARCLRVSPGHESQEFVSAMVTRLASGIAPRSAPQVRETCLESLAQLDRPEADERVLMAIRGAVAPRARRAGRGPADSPEVERGLYESHLRRLPENLRPFLAALRSVPPSQLRRVLGTLVQTRFEHEFLAAAHLFRMLDLDLDEESLGSFMHFVDNAAGNRPMHLLVEALGQNVVGRGLELLFAQPTVVSNPFPLGRLLRQGTNAEGERALMDALESPDERVRQVAIFVHAARGDAIALGELEAYASSGHGSRRWFAAAALEGIVDPLAISTLEQLKKDPDTRVRKEARASLVTTRKQQIWDGISPQAEALDSEPHAQAAGALVQRALEEGGRPLLVALLRERTPGARAAVTDWLAAVVSAGETSAGSALDALPDDIVTAALSRPEAARAILSNEELCAGSESRAVARSAAVATTLAEALVAEGRSIPLGADHEGIKQACAQLVSMLADAAAPDSESLSPLAGEVLHDRLGAKVGTLAETLRNLLTRGGLEERGVAWALESLRELGGGVEMIRVVADPAFESGAPSALLARLVRDRVLPQRHSRPDPLLSVAARRALAWIGKGSKRSGKKGGGASAGTLPESEVEVCIDPWPYLWFRRLAGQDQKSRLGASLARILGKDADEERRGRNLELVRQVDGGLLAKVHEAAGLPPPGKGRREEREGERDEDADSEEQGRKRKRKRRRGSRRGEEAPAQANAGGELEPTSDVSVEGDGAPKMPPVASRGAPAPAARPPAADPRPDSESSPATTAPPDRAPSEQAAAGAVARAPRDPGGGRPDRPRGDRPGRERGRQGRGERDRRPQSPRPAAPAAPAAPPRPATLADSVAAWWTQRTAVQPFGRGATRKGKRPGGSKLRELIDQLGRGEMPDDCKLAGVLSGLLALCPSIEDSKILLDRPELAAAIARDLTVSQDRPWHREASRRHKEITGS